MSPDTPSIAQTIEFLEKALCDSDSPRSYAPLVEAYRLAGRLDDALRTAERGSAAFPAHVGIRIVLARVLTDLGDFERARTAYLQVLSLDPGNMEALSLAGPDAEVPGQPGPPGAEAPGQPDDDAARRPGMAPAAQDEARQGRDADEAREGVPGRQDLSGRPGSLSEELAHLDELFASPAHGESGHDTGEEPAGIATLTLAEIYSRQGLTREAVRICETILERQPDNEEAKRALDSYLSQPASA